MFKHALAAVSAALARQWGLPDATGNRRPVVHISRIGGTYVVEVNGVVAHKAATWSAAHSWLLRSGRTASQGSPRMG